MSADPRLDIEIYVRLLEEGTDVFRPTRAVSLGDDHFKILPTEHYDPEDELWEFPPGSVVRAESKEFAGRNVILAGSLAE